MQSTSTFASILDEKATLDTILDGTRGNRKNFARIRKWWPVYRMVLERHGISKIAAVQGCSPQAIHSMLRTLERRGYLRRVLGKRYPLLFERGTRAGELELLATRDWHISPDTDAKSRILPTGIAPQIGVRFHVLAVAFEIRAIDLSTLNGWRQYKKSAANAQSFTTDVEVQGQSHKVEIRGSKLLVYMPAVTVQTLDDYLAAPGRIRDAAKEIATIVGEKYHVSFDPRGYFNQAPEIAFEDSNGILLLARHFLLRAGDLWTDTSKGFPELETHSYGMGLIVFSLVEGLRTGKAFFIGTEETPFVLRDGRLEIVQSIKQMSNRDRTNP